MQIYTLQHYLLVHMNQREPESEPEIFGHPMEIECDNCKKPVMIIQLTQSIVHFKVTCHRCGTVIETGMDGWNQPPDHQRRIEDESFREFQNSNT